MVEEMILWSAGLIAGFFIINKLVQQLQPRKKEKKYDEEIADILTKDDYKVKGKFE